MRQNILYPDFQDFIRELNKVGVEYLLIGGYSVILHGYHRSTGDLDIWVNQTKANFKKLQHAFLNFGLTTVGISESSFMNSVENDVFTFGRSPICIDILTKVTGLEFEAAFKNSEWFDIQDDLKVRAIRLDDLIATKRAVNRPKDKDDIQNLKKGKHK